MDLPFYVTRYYDAIYLDDISYYRDMAESRDETVGDMAGCGIDGRKTVVRKADSVPGERRRWGIRLVAVARERRRWE